MTHFLEDHPGGGDSIVINAGRDSSEEFNVLHSDKARRMLEDYYIGELETVEVVKVRTQPRAISICTSKRRTRGILLVRTV